MHDHLIDTSEDSNRRARALLLRISRMALERAEAILGDTPRFVYDGHDHKQEFDTASRLIEAAAHGIEVAIGPIDPPDAAPMAEAVRDAVARGLEKSSCKIAVYIGDEEIARNAERGAARYQYVGGTAEDPADRREG